MPALPLAAVLSFLKDTRGMITWTARDLVETLKIKMPDAAQILAILEMQGYVKAQGAGVWMTTPAGITVSCSRQPRFTCETVTQALEELTARIAAGHENKKTPFKITEAVAFGDFLCSRPRVQAADVGIALVRRKVSPNKPNSAVEHREKLSFLRQLRAKAAPLNLRLYETWMSKRAHKNLYTLKPAETHGRQQNK